MESLAAYLDPGPVSNGDWDRSEFFRIDSILCWQDNRTSLSIVFDRTCCYMDNGNLLRGVGRSPLETLVVN
jgi:hypothetical protein